MLVVKLKDKFYSVVKYAKKVEFSTDEDWLLLERQLDLPLWKRAAEWVPAATRFDWVREFNFK